MNNWCIYWLFTTFLLGILIFKGLTARRLYKSFDFKGLIYSLHVQNKWDPKTVMIYWFTRNGNGQPCRLYVT
jgi:hypothetical protein